MKDFEKFKKKEKKQKNPKDKVVTQKKANLFVSGVIFLVIVIVFSGTVRNFTAVGEVERLREEIANLHQVLRTNVREDEHIDLPLVWRYMEAFIPLYIDVDFSDRDLVEERFELLSDYFSFPYSHMNYAVGSQMSRSLQSNELLSVRSYQNYDLAQYRVTYLLVENRLNPSEFEKEQEDSIEGEHGNEIVENAETLLLVEGAVEIPIEEPIHIEQSVEIVQLEEPVVTHDGEDEKDKLERVEAHYREEMTEQLEEALTEELENEPDEITSQDSIGEQFIEESLPDESHLPLQDDVMVAIREVTVVLNIPFIQSQNQIAIISLPYFTEESSALGMAEPFARMESSDSSQEMIQARQSIEEYLPIFFATYAESNEVALSLLMKDVVLMGGDFVLEDVELSQGRYRFVGDNILVQVEVVFRDYETSFSHREAFTLLLEEQANSWFVLEMHHLFVE